MSYSTKISNSTSRPSSYYTSVGNNSIAIGYNNHASGNYSKAMGCNDIIYGGTSSVAESMYTTIIGGTSNIIFGGYSRGSKPYVKDKKFGIIKSEQEAIIWPTIKNNTEYTSTRIVLFEKEIKEELYYNYSIIGGSYSTTSHYSMVVTR